MTVNLSIRGNPQIKCRLKTRKQYMDVYTLTLLKQVTSWPFPTFAIRPARENLPVVPLLPAIPKILVFLILVSHHSANGWPVGKEGNRIRVPTSI